MIRFSHTIFALPFALLAAVMAWVAPVTGDAQIRFSVLHLVAIIICMVGARSAAMAFNRLVDRYIDAENPRTAGRHLPAGKAFGRIGLAVHGGVFVSVLRWQCSVPTELPAAGIKCARVADPVWL